jgi:hypothetical protein
MSKKPMKRAATRGVPGSAMPAVLLDAGPVADVVTVPPRAAVSIEGRGAPGGEAFERSIGALYGVAYTLKFARKRGGGGKRDFKIGALEASWWAAGGGEAALARTPREKWRWRLRLAVPADVDRKAVAAAIAAATSKKGGKLEGSAEAAAVVLERVPAGRWGRVLHVGPYDQEGPSIARVVAAIEGEGGAAGPDHVEIYLDDPSRTKPEKIRTVLLLPLVERPEGAVQARRVPAPRRGTQDVHVSPAAKGWPLVR